MYQNAGKSIKDIVAIVVKIGYAVSIILAIILFISAFFAENDEAGVLIIIIAIAVGAIGCAISWLGGLWLYAYGEIADRLISIDERLADMEESDETTPAPVSVVAPTRSAFAPAPRVSAPPAGSWICNCGRVNAHYVSSCTCGTSKWDAEKK